MEQQGIDKGFYVNDEDNEDDDGTRSYYSPCASAYHTFCLAVAQKIYIYGLSEEKEKKNKKKKDKQAGEREELNACKTHK